MFCDRIAASKIYNGSSYTKEAPLLYLEKSGAKNKMAKSTYKKLRYLLQMLAQQGEEETFRFLKKTENLPECD